MEFSHKQIRDGIWHITDGRGNYCTLVAGERKAVLFDTMMGFGDLRGYVAELTPLEPMVINSHCHFDHMGGNWQFERAWLGAEDLSLMELGAQRIPTLTKTLKADLTAMECCFTDKSRVCAIEGGTVIELGGRTVEVIPLPGHTPGSIGLLCREDRLLLAGDALSPQYCIFFQESLPLAESVRTVHGLWELPFDHFLSSHFDILFPKSMLDKLEACFALPGKKRGMVYDYPILPEEHGRFFVLTPHDPETGQLIGIAVKESDAASPLKP